MIVCIVYRTILGYYTGWFVKEEEYNNLPFRILTGVPIDSESEFTIKRNKNQLNNFHPTDYLLIGKI